ncbi:MAG: (Fe-S)-binding protein [Rhodospirillales bacterium]|jgi:L-lactate dehydrogenase complex protein LldE|nr:(Fe-S)-binding protein [Rhodospirillales bacterium]
MLERRPTVALFVTCLVDLMRPAVGFAAVKLLEAAGCDVVVPSAQTCCGQPAYNSGDSKNAKALARRVIEAFAGFDYVVLPSGSCGGTIKVHYPEMFESDPVWLERARDLARRTWELTTFLAEVRKVGPVEGELDAVTAYHDSCSGLRELKIRTQPRQLLSGIRGLELREMDEADACCGFGGLFCVKYPEVSEKMVDVKVDAILASGAGMLLGGDMGCLMNMAGRLQRRGCRVEVRHVAEVLAGTTSEASPIGEAEAMRSAEPKSA